MSTPSELDDWEPDTVLFDEINTECGRLIAFIHCNLIHGSANSVSPWRRGIIYLNYNNCNAVGNACTDHSRAWYQGNRDTAPLDPVEDTALLALIFYQAPSA